MECNCLFYYRLFIVAHNQCEAPSKKIVSLFLLFFSLKKKNYIWKRQIMWETVIKKKKTIIFISFLFKTIIIVFLIFGSKEKKKTFIKVV